jgi:hypothetical protein
MYLWDSSSKIYSNRPWVICKPKDVDPQTEECRFYEVEVYTGTFSCATPMRSCLCWSQHARLSWCARSLQAVSSSSSNI